MKSVILVVLAGGAALVIALASQRKHVKQVQQLAAENEALRQQNAELQAQPAPCADADEVARLRADHLELLRLRGELAQLRQGSQTPADLERRLQVAETRAVQLEASAALEEAEALANQQSVHIINGMKSLGLAARLFATDNQDRLPTTFDEMRNYLGLQQDGTFPGGVALTTYEFFPHERTVSEAEPSMILFREINPRQLPGGVWQRTYGMADGSVQTIATPNGDFSDFERPRTGNAANAPKSP